MADLNVPGDNDANVDGYDDAPTQLATLSPTDPIMGLFLEQNPPGSGKWNARMGGKPNADWSGLQLSQIHQATPYHYRKAEMTSDIKGFTVRSTGLTEKFKKRIFIVHSNHLLLSCRSNVYYLIFYLKNYIYIEIYNPMVLELYQTIHLVLIVYGQEKQVTK